MAAFIVIAPWALASDLTAVAESRSTLLASLNGVLGWVTGVAHYLPGYGFSSSARMVLDDRHDPEKLIPMLVDVLRAFAGNMRGLDADDWVSQYYRGMTEDGRAYELIVRVRWDDPDSMEVWRDGRLLPVARPAHEPGGSLSHPNPFGGQAAEAADSDPHQALPDQPFVLQLRPPLAVLLDHPNAGAHGSLRHASAIFELPIEGGGSSLMLTFDRTDPERIGPIRQSREYHVELAERLGAILVHNGGSPGALAAITVSSARTLDATKRSDLFVLTEAGSAMGVFASGSRLREEVARLGRPDRTVSGTLFRPAANARKVSAVVMNLGGPHSSGFQYEPTANAYIRMLDGTSMLDEAGEPVSVEAVLLGEVSARPFPNDPEGRLSIPLRGGEATLYLSGRATTGRWELRDQIGFRFVTDDGAIVDLAPFKIWVALSPGYPSRATVP